LNAESARAGPDLHPWEISGTYLEACNCDPICPCRTIDGVGGGRSTHGECLGALSWSIERGRAGEVDLSGLGAVIATRYHDDEPGSPWSFFLYVDERGDEAQRDALEQILVGRLGGTTMEHFPWAWKPSDLLGVRAARIEIDHTPGRGWFRAGGEVTVRVREPFVEQGVVTCVIPGHDREGTEVVAGVLRVEAGPLQFDLEGVCGYESTFAYSSG
jgi:hypothetical protein